MLVHAPTLATIRESLDTLYATAYSNRFTLCDSYAAIASSSGNATNVSL